MRFSCSVLKVFSVMRLLLIISLVFLLTAVTSAAATSTYGQFEIRLVSFESRKGIDSGILWELCLTNFQRNPVDNAVCGFSEPVAVFSSILRRGIAIPFNFAWPGSFTLFIQARNASLPFAFYNFNDVVFKKALASENITANDEWNEVELYDQKYSAVAVISYRVKCAGGRFGKYCKEVMCQAGGKILTCSSDGKVTCAPGWTGERCDQAICDACQRTGQCVGPGVCKCDIGWTGPDCGQCITRPGCKNGTCQKPNDCICDKGWGGIFCDEDLEYCAHHKPCFNGATCLNKGNGSYTCDCRPGYTGLNCETKQQVCLIAGRKGSEQDEIARACQNGGRCVRHSSGEYHCECPSGYTGDYCQNCSHCCPVDACLNGGTCFDGNLGNYVCACPPGFEGRRCENVASVCAGLCKHGGTCVWMSSQFVCKCPLGFKGPFCEDTMNPCEKNPCENNGRCIGSEDGLYECRCASGYQGKNCDISVIGCEQQPCGNGSTCVSTPSGYECHCGPCYTGLNCRTVDEHCLLKMSHTWNSLTESFLIVIAVLIFLILVVLIVFVWWRCRTHQSAVDPITENMINVRRSRLYQLPTVDSKLNGSTCDPSAFKYKPVPVSRLKAVTQCNQYEDHQRGALGSHNRLNLKNIDQSGGELQGDEELYAEVDDSPYNTDFPRPADSRTAKLGSELKDLNYHTYERPLHFSKCPEVHTNV